MQMENPPHPGWVLREYLGELSVTMAAAHLAISRVATIADLRQSRFEWMRGYIGRPGFAARGCVEHLRRFLADDAGERPVASCEGTSQEG